jgi:sarcosine oxidase
VSQPVYGAVVIGGGVVGLAAAWHLQRLGCGPVAVVERSHVGHGGGSSHGSARMTRSTYTSAAYAGLMRHVRDDEWPRLERAAGVTLVRAADVVFFGPDRATLRGYAAAVEAAGVAVERLSPDEARRRFPALRITDEAEILHDRTGGTIAAAETIRALHRLVASAGADVREETRVRAIDRTGDVIRIVSDRGTLHTDRVVIAAGAWLPGLVPAARDALTVVPQTVAYVQLAEPASTLPSWVYFGGDPAGPLYGLPEVGSDAFKVGRHVTRGAGVDPDQPVDAVPGEAEALRDQLEHIVSVPVRELVGSEPCLYTMTSTEDFIIDTWPGDPRVAFASACSGHGFKFAPLTGRILAELVVHGTVGLPGGRDARSLFALDRRAASPEAAG